MIDRDYRERLRRCYACGRTHSMSVSCSRAAALRMRRDIFAVLLLAIGILSIAALLEWI